MHVCLNRLSALALLRQLRATEDPSCWEACGIPDPDPWPLKRWSARAVPYTLLGRDRPPSSRDPLEIMVAVAQARPKASFISSRVIGTELPAGSFVRVSDEFTVPCPELLYLELSRVMHPAALTLVGYELCGAYARNPLRPRTGPVTHGLAPLTSVSKIRSYLDKCKGVRGIGVARTALEDVRDNAWSAMEAIVSLLLVRDVKDRGYGIKGITLNERETFVGELSSKTLASSRVPDISLNELPVCFNYDGYGHLDLNSIDVVALEAGDLKGKLAEVRAKYVDDLRRNRELLAQGRIVLPLVAEDLFEWGGLDAAVLEAVLAAERITGTSGEVGRSVRSALKKPHVARRQQLIWSLYPWEGGSSLGAY